MWISREANISDAHTLTLSFHKGTPKAAVEVVMSQPAGAAAAV